jgi:hypothetical protein
VNLSPHLDRHSPRRAKCRTSAGSGSEGHEALRHSGQAQDDGECTVKFHHVFGECFGRKLEMSKCACATRISAAARAVQLWCLMQLL